MKILLQDGLQQTHVFLGIVLLKDWHFLEQYVLYACLSFSMIQGIRLLSIFPHTEQAISERDILSL